jgi:hypothetical protein
VETRRAAARGPSLFDERLSSCRLLVGDVFFVTGNALVHSFSPFSRLFLKQFNIRSDSQVEYVRVVAGIQIFRLEVYGNPYLFQAGNTP